MGVIKAMRTRDGKFRVLIHEDQTAELANEKGQLLTARVPLYKIGAELAERGVSADELIED